MSYEALDLAIRAEDNKRDHRQSKVASPIKEIWHQHHEVIRLAVLGWGTLEIAKMTSFTPIMIRNILGSEVVKRQIDLMRGALDKDALDIRKEIDALAPTAIEVLRGVMEDDNASNRDKLMAATDVLDRAGYAPPKVVNATIASVSLTPAELEELKQRAREARMMSVTDANKEE